MTLVAVVGALTAAQAIAAASISRFGSARYAQGFTHFDYADPNAPIGGTLQFANYDASTSYDTLNPFLIGGSVAPDVRNLMFDTLMQRSWDELGVEYPLIADDVEIARGGTSATFHINSAARFSNGDPITAADVKYSFDTLASSDASPLINSEFQAIRSADVIDRLTVRFDFRPGDRDGPLIAGDLPVFSPKWGMRPDGTRPPFNQISNVPPIASGPYLVEQRKNDKEITYRRNSAYWATDLPSRRGMYRFERVSFKLYTDNPITLEAFKAGAIDVDAEGSSSVWARRYVGRKFDSGELIKHAFPDGPPNMQGIAINSRRPMFRDVRVREALTLAFDYDWMNRMMFYGQYRRSTSYFDPATFGASGTPSGKELALLDPFRTGLPPEVFGPMIKPPSTLLPHSLRSNLRKARDLLAAAGWQYGNGALRDQHGTPMKIEILSDDPGYDRILVPYAQTLGILGIDAWVHRVDAALEQRRVDYFDYDMDTEGYSNISIPGPELSRRFSCKTASETGSENYTGVCSKAVDALIQAAQKASTLDDLETATRALDRVLMNGYYMVPEFYSPNARIGYNAMLGFPSVIPKSYSDADWIIGYWYWRSPR